jgi:hypothetical protein
MEKNMKRQKVRFHKSDKRPSYLSETLTYEKKMVKKGRSIFWQAIEQPTKTIIKQSFFEEDIEKIVNFQNEHKQWQRNGGIPKFLCDHIY